MSASFGIDHPLIAVNDINSIRERLISMGLNMTPIGKHPWGTNNTLAMFDSCLVEFVGIYDETLLDEKPAGSFHFGRHVYEHLQVREGVALSALHSTQIQNDILHAEHSGLLASGSLEFGRDVVLPNGSTDRTKTSLALLPNLKHPRLSLFLCQQHKPELIYVPEWLTHPNTAYGYNGITIRAEAAQQPELQQQLNALYGGSEAIEQGFRVTTANGTISVQSEDAINSEYSALPSVVSQDLSPAIVAMDIKCRDLETLERHIRASGLNYAVKDKSITLSDPETTGNTIFRFIEVA